MRRQDAGETMRLSTAAFVFFVCVLCGLVAALLVFFVFIVVTGVLGGGCSLVFFSTAFDVVIS